MIKSWKKVRMSICFIRTVEGVPHYFVVVNREPVEVTKEVYHVVESSYYREWCQRKWEDEHDCVSYEQLADDITEQDRHGHVLPQFQTSSAEEDFFESLDYDQDSHVIGRMIDELSSLPDEKKEMLYSYVKDPSYIDRTAERDCVTKAAVYQRRKRLGNAIAKRIMEGEDNE